MIWLCHRPIDITLKEFNLTLKSNGTIYSQDSVALTIITTIISLFQSLFPTSKMVLLLKLGQNRLLLVKHFQQKSIIHVICLFVLDLILDYLEQTSFCLYDEIAGDEIGREVGGCAFV